MANLGVLETHDVLGLEIMIVSYELYVPTWPSHGYCPFQSGFAMPALSKHHPTR